MMMGEIADFLPFYQRQAFEPIFIGLLGAAEAKGQSPFCSSSFLKYRPIY
jgi:hypothetical protein